MNLLKEDEQFAEKIRFVKSISNEDAKAINEKVVNKGIGITVQEAYCDGSNIFISYLLEVEEGKLRGSDALTINEFVNDGDVTASFSNEKLEVANTAFKKVDDNTYAVVQYLDLMQQINNGVEIPEEFELEIDISIVRGGKANEGETTSFFNR